MRFSAPNKSSLKRSRVSPAVDLTNVYMENCVFEDDCIKARPGVFARPEEQIFNNLGTLDSEMSLIATQCYLYIDGRYCRVAVSVADNMTDNIAYSMRLVYSDGEVQDIGLIEFVRTSFDQFGRPESFTVFSGEPTQGCGIYFIARQTYENGYPDFVRIMELNEEMNGWNLVTDSKIYAPTVLANGRGESYYTAAPLGEPLDLKDPVKPESRNLLGSGFICFYTADSASVAFALPYSELDEDTVECNFYYQGSTYSWKIYSGETASSALKVGTTQVTMHCDRTAGRIWFEDASGNKWAPYYTGALNNIRIKASKTFFEDTVKVASMSACCRLGGDSLSSGSKVTAFYSSRLYPATVILNSPDHPLYFPEDGQQILGEPQLTVMHMLMKDRCIFAVKENEVYAAEISGNYENTGPMVSETGAQSDTGIYRLAFKRVAALPEAPLERSIALMGGDIVFMSKTGILRRLYGSGTSVYKIQEIGKNDFLETENAFAVAEGSRYLLISGKDVLVLEKRNGEFFICRWSLPERAEHGFSYLSKAVLFAVLSDKGMYLVYPARFSDEEDHFITTDGSGLALNKKSVKAVYRAPLPPDGEEKKRICRVRIDGRGNTVNIAVCDGDIRLLERTAVLKAGRAYADCGAVAVSPVVRLSFTSDFAFKAIVTEYRLLNTL